MHETVYDKSELLINLYLTQIFQQFFYMAYKLAMKSSLQRKN